MSRPKVKCVDCGTEAKGGGECWTITKEGNWLCDDCWDDSWNNDKKPDWYQYECKHCQIIWVGWGNTDDEWECLNCDNRAIIIDSGYYKDKRA